MQARMKNPAALLPGAMQAIQALMASAQKAGTPAAVLQLVHLRASQINGCGPCVDGGVKHAKQAGETDERLFAVAAWRETPYFSDAERAALALAEAMTRLDDRADPVPDHIWTEAAKHYDERALSGLLLWIAITNLFNRLKCHHPASRWRRRLVSHRAFSDNVERVKDPASGERRGVAAPTCDCLPPHGAQHHPPTLPPQSRLRGEGGSGYAITLLHRNMD